MRRVGLLCWFATTPGLANATCSVEFQQDGEGIQTSMRQGWHVVELKKAPFRLRISPGKCGFLVATLVDTQSIAEAEKLTPIVFAGAGTAGAALPADGDILNWPSRTPIHSSLKEQGYGWQVLDVYKQESALLGFAPQVIQAWGSAWPLKPVEDSVVADFNRLTSTIPLDATMPIRTLPGIIYLKKKELLKPAWEGAQPTLYLLEPYRVLYVFK